jgi:cellulose biosynthesis protein BcsQ
MRTLLVDLDPQAHATASFAIDSGRLDRHASDLLTAPRLGERELSELLWPVADGLTVAPGSFALARLESASSSLATRDDRDQRLTMALGALGSRFDMVFVDTPASLGLLAFNATLAADVALVPADCGSAHCVASVERQLAAIGAIGRSFGRTPTVRVLANRTSERSLSRSVRAALEDRVCGSALLRSPDGGALGLPDDTAYAKSSALGITVGRFAPERGAAVAAERVAVALMHVELTEPASTCETVGRDDGPCEGGGAGRDGTTGGVAETKPGALSIARSHAPPAGLFAWSADERGGASGFVEAQPEPVGDGVRDDGGARDGGAAFAQRVGSGDAGAGVERWASDVGAPTTRAAELAARTRAVAAQIERRRAAASRSPGLANAIEEAGSRGPLARWSDAVERGGTRGRGGAAAHAGPDRALRSLLGVRPTAAGALFLIDAAPGSSVAIAGEFNGWSAEADVARFNEQAGVFEAVIPLAAGEHRYQLVIDGVAELDPANSRVVEAPGRGRANAVFIPTGRGCPVGAGSSGGVAGSGVVGGDS